MNAAHTLGFRLVLATLFGGCLLGLLHAASVLPLHVPLDPNEGWNAYFAQTAIATGSPYPSKDSFLVNNYPPLSFFLIGGLARLFGDAIIVGRAVSFLAFCVVALGIGKAARSAGCSTEHAAFASLIFVACLLLTSDYVGMDDPQLLGHAIAIGGMLVALRASRSSRDMVISALLLTVAFFVKHNLILLPAALTTWLLLVDRRHAGTFILSGAIFLLIGLGLFRDAFGTPFFQQIDSARLYTFDNVRVAALNWLPWAAIPVTGALLLLVVGRKDQLAVFAVIYSVFATVGGLMLSGGTGVDANALFDADIALSLCAGLLLDRFENGNWLTFAALFYAVPLAFLLRQVDGNWRDSAYWLRPMSDDARISSTEISLLRTKPDPVLCEMLSLCYWAAKAPQVDVFNTDQRLRTGTQGSAELVRMIDQKRFSFIQLETLKPFPLPPAVEVAVMRNYRVVRVDNDRAFLGPR